MFKLDKESKQQLKLLQFSLFFKKDKIKIRSKATTTAFVFLFHITCESLRKTPCKTYM